MAATFDKLLGKLLMHSHSAGDISGGVGYYESNPVTASGASVDFTGIPSNAKKVVIALSSISVDISASSLFARIGDAGGFETTDYASVNLRTANAVSPAVLTSSLYFYLQPTLVSAYSYSGIITFELIDSAAFTWVGTCVLQNNNVGEVYVSAMNKSLSDTLTQIQIGTTSGSFDAGKIKLSYFTS